MASHHESVSTDRRRHGRSPPFSWLTNAVYRLIRWIAAHSRGFHSAVGGYLAVGFGIVLGTLALFALLANVVAGGAIQRFDEAVVIGARGLETPLLDAFALVGAVLGSGTAAWTVIIGGTFFLWRSNHRYSVLLLWVSLLGARLLNEPMKGWFGRPRPALVRGDVDLLGMTFAFPESYSFPSGHALTSTVIFFTLAYLVARLEPEPSMRRDTFIGAALIVLIVAASRIYLGVHYPSDVIAGILVGFLWATTAALGIEAVRYFRTRKPEVAESERDLEDGIEPIQEALHA